MRRSGFSLSESEQRSFYNRQRRLKFASQGLCVTCGAVRAEGRSRCAGCLAYAHRYYRSEKGQQSLARYREKTRVENSKRLATDPVALERYVNAMLRDIQEFRDALPDERAFEEDHALSPSYKLEWTSVVDYENRSDEDDAVAKRLHSRFTVSPLWPFQYEYHHSLYEKKLPSAEKTAEIEAELSGQRPLGETYRERSVNRREATRQGKREARQEARRLDEDKTQYLGDLYMAIRSILSSQMSDAADARRQTKEIFDYLREDDTLYRLYNKEEKPKTEFVLHLKKLLTSQ